ncbi:pyridoxal phosphate-dependent aminotransferase [Gilvibacter sediminis]|uniref:pyridoxal phosphate-dependent aminotransferase n=1 Tax=Gilvibacter sediminis TaxID=379071 RepID=UPI00234FFDAB|nr:aminotransferase class I/II-fold pyridoxal phosphate-dependent enzyme [Gilvibacter sediminis]MDC7998679.1 aminotransferase class I/II-fold pyridoxal phosphate-dependent enzyme [Gilvibacter sediminis]
MITASRLGQTKEYYFSRKLREVRQRMADGRPVINLGIGSPDLPPAPEVTAALQDALAHPKAHQYQSYQGIPELREAIANFYEAHYKVALNAETEVLPLMGSKEGIMHISMAFLNPGDQVLIPNPGYPTYAAVARLVEADIRTYDLNADQNWLPDLDALAQTDLSKVKIMWVNYPHMPTGATATKDFFVKLIAFAKAHQILIVNDNPYSFILNDTPVSLLEIPDAKEVVLELNSLSKTFNMAGWRVGMLCGNAEFIQAVLKVKSNMDSGMFYGLQKGAIAALGMDKNWFEQLNGTYARRREWAWKIANALGGDFSDNQQGLFVWVKLPEGASAEAVADRLLEEVDLFITPGTVFGTAGEGYIRISLCVSLTDLEAAHRRIIDKNIQL